MNETGSSIIIDFCIGFLGIIIGATACYSYTSRGIADLEARVTASTEIAREYKNKLDTVGYELSEITEENRRLTVRFREATDELEQLTDQLQFIENGVSDDIEGISRVIEGIDFYIQQTTNKD